MTTIAALPSDLLRSVFAMLPLPAIGRCAQVCRSWHALADEDRFWRSKLPPSEAEHHWGALRAKDVVQYRHLVPEFNSKALYGIRFTFNPILQREPTIWNCIAALRCMSSTPHVFSILSCSGKLTTARDRRRAAGLEFLDVLVGRALCYATAATTATMGAGFLLLLYPSIPLLRSVPFVVRFCAFAPLTGLWLGTFGAFLTGWLDVAFAFGIVLGFPVIGALNVPVRYHLSLLGDLPSHGAGTLLRLSALLPLWSHGPENPQLKWLLLATAHFWPLMMPLTLCMGAVETCGRTAKLARELEYKYGWKIRVGAHFYNRLVAPPRPPKSEDNKNGPSH